VTGGDLDVVARDERKLVEVDRLTSSVDTRARLDDSLSSHVVEHLSLVGDEPSKRHPLGQRQFRQCHQRQILFAGHVAPKRQYVVTPQPA